MEPSLEFENILKDSVDKGLSILGESPKQAVYSYLEKECNLPKEKIASNPDLLVPAIERIFGSGAKLLETQILKTLYEKVGLNFEPNEQPRIALTSSLDKVRKALDSKEQVPVNKPAAT